MKRNIVESYSIEEAFRALNKKPQSKVVEAAGQLTDNIIRRTLNRCKSEFEPIDSQVSFDGYVETVAGDLYAKYIYGGDFSGAFLSAKEEAELAALETRVQTAANELLGTNYTLRSHMSESTKKVNESVDDAIVTLPGDTWGYPEFFADEVEEFGPEITANMASMGDKAAASVVAYYYNKKLSAADLKVKNIFVVNPKMYDGVTEEEAEELLAQIKEDPAYVPSGFGFQLANNDYLYTDENHNVGPVYVKCRDYNSMVKYIKGEVELDRAPFGDAKDIIEEDTKKVVESASNAWTYLMYINYTTEDGQRDDSDEVCIIQNSDTYKIEGETVTFKSLYELIMNQIKSAYTRAVEFEKENPVDNEYNFADAWDVDFVISRKANEQLTSSQKRDLKAELNKFSAIESINAASLIVDELIDDDEATLNKPIAENAKEATKKLVESAPVIPAPYDKYFEIVNYSAEELEGMASYLPGEVVEEYNAKILAFVDPKDGYEDTFDSIYYLVDEEGDVYVAEIQGTASGTRIYSVDLEDYDI